MRLADERLQRRVVEDLQPRRRRPAMRPASRLRRSGTAAASASAAARSSAPTAHSRPTSDASAQRQRRRATSDGASRHLSGSPDPCSVASVGGGVGAGAGACCFEPPVTLSTATYSIGIRQHAEDRRDEHAGEHRHAHHLARLGAGARRRQQRHDAEDEREGGHQNRPEPQLRRRQRRVHERLALVVLHLGELDDQNRVLRRQADQHDQPDLREHVVHVARADEPARQPEAEVGAERRERRAEQHAERQAPALVLRGQNQEHEEDASANTTATPGARRS